MKDAIASVFGNFWEMATTFEIKITSIDVRDVRFPTARSGHGSDAMVRKQDMYIYCTKLIKPIYKNIYVYT